MADSVNDPVNDLLTEPYNDLTDAKSEAKVDNCTDPLEGVMKIETQVTEDQSAADLAKEPAKMEADKDTSTKKSGFLQNLVDESIDDIIMSHCASTVDQKLTIGKKNAALQAYRESLPIYKKKNEFLEVSIGLPGKRFAKGTIFISSAWCFVLFRHSTRIKY